MSNAEMIDEIAEQALQVAEDRREAFVADACDGDSRLFSKIMDLLRDVQVVEESGFLQRPQLSGCGASDSSVADDSAITNPLELPAQVPDTPKHRIGNYLIQHLLGKGGMGVVYLAYDRKLQRQVAIKVPRIQGERRQVLLERFLREAQTLAAIQHPNICPIYEVGKPENDKPYIVMPYINGQLFSELANEFQSKQDRDRAVSLVRKLALALDYVHKRGVIHRDLKPSNIILGPVGEPIIMDFGLARWEERQDGQLTTQGNVLGTPAYMAPEQVEGDFARIGPESDIYSLGIILYQFLAGRLPFTGSTLSILAQIANHVPDRPSQSRPVASALDEIVLKCIAKRPVDRFRSMAEFAHALGNWSSHPPSNTSRKRVSSIAVLPFKNLSSDEDNEFFCRGLADELTNRLASVSNLNVAPASALGNRDTSITETGRALSVDMILDGSVRKSGNQLRITAQLVDCGNGFQEWSERFDCEIGDVFATQDEISLAIVGKLKIQLAREERHSLTKRHTEDTTAYQLYLKGRYHWSNRRQSDLAKAIGYFERAILEDPHYAKAHAGLADCYTMCAFYGYLPGSEAYPKSQAAAAKAIGIDPSQAEAHAALGAALAFGQSDWNGAEEACKAAIDCDERYINGHSFYAGMVLSPQKRFDEAITQIKFAQSRDPLSLVINAATGCVCWLAHRFEQAIDEASKALELNSSFWFAHSVIGLASEQLGRLDEAKTAFEKAIQFSAESSMTLGMLAHACGRVGEHEAAGSALDQMKRLGNQGYVSAYDLAVAHIGMGDVGNAIACLHQAVEERANWVCFVGCDARFQPLDGDLRFAEVLKQLNLKA